MKDRKKVEEYNLGVGVLAGSVSFLAGSFALSMLPLSPSTFGFFIVAAIIALLALAVAIYGRVSIFKQFVKGLINSLF